MSSGRGCWNALLVWPIKCSISTSHRPAPKVEPMRNAHRNRKLAKRNNAIDDVYFYCINWPTEECTAGERDNSKTTDRKNEDVRVSQQLNGFAVCLSVIYGTAVYFHELNNKYIIALVNFGQTAAEQQWISWGRERGRETIVPHSTHCNWK